MKATKPGQMIGKALEDFGITQNNSDSQNSGISDKSDSSDSPNLSESFRTGKILVLVNPSFADPSDFLSSLSLDSDGNFIIPKIKSASIIIDPATVDPSIGTASASLTTREESTQSAESSQSSKSQELNLSREIASLEKRIKGLEDIITKDTPRQVNDIDELNLTPPQVLLATDSAQLAEADLNMRSDPKIAEKLKIYELEISDSFKVFGKSILSETLIAGNLTIDGILSIENGNEINAIDTLYLQKSLLAQKIDIFNSKVVIDKSGNITAAQVSAEEYKVIANKTSGSGKIPLGASEILVENEKITSGSRIFITPINQTEMVLAVTEKLPGKGFKITPSSTASEDILFDWWMINEVEPINDS
jgi:hypothetical protein